MKLWARVRCLVFLTHSVDGSRFHMYGQFYDGSPWIKSGCAQKWMQLQRWGEAVMRPFAKLLKTLLTIIKPKRTAYSRDGLHYTAMHAVRNYETRKICGDGIGVSGVANSWRGDLINRSARLRPVITATGRSHRWARPCFLPDCRCVSSVRVRTFVPPRSHSAPRKPPLPTSAPWLGFKVIRLVFRVMVIVTRVEIIRATNRGWLCFFMCVWGTVIGYYGQS